ncbi:MAG: thiol peroxidase [Flavobacteriales bacterium]|nr:thiol peroxidase [Flavobacteriales bacterium]
MAAITLGGNPCNTIGDIPSQGQQAPDFQLVRDDMTDFSSSDLTGKRVVLNIFPSVDTGVCAASARKFNELASQMDNTQVLCVSRDLPFAQKRFCGAEGLDNVIMLSDFRTGDFGKDYGLTITDGAFNGLHSRVVIVVDEDGKVLHSEQVPEIGQEPDYDAAMAVL